jgi:23S rRNA pseudouridine955/2504/2580 synthase
VAEPPAGGQGVTVVEVAAEDEGSRLDRWFRRHFPHLSHGRVEKLLRTGQVRLDGKRVKANARLAAGAKIRLPPMPAPSPERAEARVPRPAPKLGKEEIEALRALVIHKDADVLAINKPPGLAVQGGTGMTKHLDAMLDALKFDSPERPRLVHRLDKDTSGVLLLARNRAAAAKLGESLRGREARKLYWAVVVGVPKPKKGRIDLPLSKLPHPKGERIAPDEEEGKRAETLYAVIETLGNKAAWLALMPLTGRTHQLRVHCAALGTPILGDGKYGGQGAYLTGEGLSRKLHLHAREILVPHPKGGKLKVTAELPEHMRKTWKLLGFDEKSAADPFAEAGW